jgi:hypothetical protein
VCSRAITCFPTAYCTCTDESMASGTMFLSLGDCRKTLMRLGTSLAAWCAEHKLRAQMMEMETFGDQGSPALERQHNMHKLHRINAAGFMVCSVCPVRFHRSHTSFCHNRLYTRGACRRHGYTMMMIITGCCCFDLSCCVGFLDMFARSTSQCGGMKHLDYIDYTRAECEVTHDGS